MKITSHPDSFDRILDDGKTIYYVGKGNKPTPAHPTKNQDSSQQEVFRTSIITKKSFPVLYKESPNNVYLLGHYRVENLKKSRRNGIEFYYAILKKIQ